VLSCKYNGATQNETVRPYEDIPTPPGGWIPGVGHGYLLVKKPAGMEQTWKNVAELVNHFI